MNNAGRSYAASVEEIDPAEASAPGIQAGGGPSSNYADGDKPEFVANLVVQAIEEGRPQYFANERLRKLAGAAG
ncbi:MAG TPA: hypothetical protein VMD06_01980 [Steroidobacteraceae bacterium]|nr:hypothetical protein [Steroidobacteraceae bacterium]